MTIRPCPDKILCDCREDPFRNLSAEAEDPNTFFARRFYRQDINLNDNSTWWIQEACEGVCYSEISQEDANDCALHSAQQCVDTPVEPEIIDDPPPGTPPRAGLFGNQAQSCTSPCPGGAAPFVYTVPANTFFALSQQLANALAASYCQQRAIIHRVCAPPMPPQPPQAQCPTVTGTSPASPILRNVGDDVSMFVTVDYNGFGPLTYLWLFNGAPYLITMNPSLSIEDLELSDSGEYVLLISAPGCSVVSSPAFVLLVGCVPEEPPPAAPKFNPTAGEYDYVTQVSIGVFEVQETGNTNALSGGGKNFTSLGALSAGWYQVFYRGGATMFTDPMATVFFDCDAFGADFEVSGIPQTTIVDIPFNLSIFATCNLAEDSVGGPDTDLSGIFETSASAGGVARVWGPAYQTAAGWSMARCNGSWPQLEVIHHQLPAMPTNLRIVDFDAFKAAIMICSTCQDRIGVEWDGEFTRVVYDPFDLLYQADVVSATASFNNKRISSSSCQIFLSEESDGTPIWVMELKCKRVGQPNGGGSGDIFWSGTKRAGRTPDGVYTSLEEACVPGMNPACCRLEAF